MLCVYVCVHACVYVCVFMCVCMCVCVCVHVCVCVCVCVCVYVVCVYSVPQGSINEMSILLIQLNSRINTHELQRCITYIRT